MVDTSKLGTEERRTGGDRRDPVVEKVRADLHARSQLGIAKYGSTLEENPGDARYWIQHAYEEALDLANYLARLIMEHDAKLDAFDQAFDAQTTKHPEEHGPTCECNECWSRRTAADR